MKRILLSIILALLIACAPAQEAKPDEKIKVGLILTLTGGQSNYGEGLRKGIDLALKEVNNIDVVIEDEQSDAKVAVTTFNKLTDIDGVKIIIGPVLSGSVLAVAPLAEQKKVITLTATATAAKISDAGDHIFRIRETATGHGRKMAEYAASKEWTKGAVLNVNAEAGISYADAFKHRFKELGGIIIIEEMYEKDAQDMRTQAAKIIAAKPEFVYFPGFAKDIGMSMKQLRELGYKGAFITTPAMEDQAFFTAAGTAGEGAVYSSAFNPASPKAIEFMQKYEQAYGKEGFSWFIANAYDAAKLVSKIIDTCDENVECIKQQLYATQNYEGASGTFSFDAKGDVNRPLILMQVKGNSFVPLEE
jgi:branched-chain amino acid transport system substrate-binding protein